MEHVKSRISNQLCLYREGYCDTLIGMAKILGEKNMRMQALFFADEAVKFILYAVMNRWERCNYLLQLCCEYARWGETLKVQTTYAEVLKSSMGPDWYKEAQLDLINEFRKSDIPLDAVQVAHMAAIFEEASGEMTFQRYVQQEKTSLWQQSPRLLLYQMQLVIICLKLCLHQKVLSVMLRNGRLTCLN